MRTLEQVIEEVGEFTRLLRGCTTAFTNVHSSKLRLVLNTLVSGSPEVLQLALIALDAEMSAFSKLFLRKEEIDFIKYVATLKKRYSPDPDELAAMEEILAMSRKG
jgi:hypothetical protein